MKVFLDAGHGGNDPGAVSNGCCEKHLNLEAALEVGKRLEAAGVEVVYSRTTDVNPGSPDVRGRMAKGCDYMLSLHFNAGGGAGTEILCNCRETIGATEYHLKEALKRFFRFRKIASRRLETAAFVSRSVQAVAPYKFHQTVASSDWYGVLRGCWQVGVSGDLLEICFIDNREDIGAYLESKEEVWDAIASAVCTAFKVPAPKPESPAVVKGNLYSLTIGPLSAGDKKAFDALAKELAVPCVSAEV